MKINVKKLRPEFREYMLKAFGNIYKSRSELWGKLNVSVTIDRSVRCHSWDVRYTGDGIVYIQIGEFLMTPPDKVLDKARRVSFAIEKFPMVKEVIVEYSVYFSKE